MKFDTALYAITFALLALFAAPAKNDADGQIVKAAEKPAPKIALQPAEADHGDEAKTKTVHGKYAPI